MIGRTFRTILAVLLLAGMTALPALARNPCSPGKNLTRGCKNEIKACIASECASLTKRDKRLCKKSCKRDTVADCKLDNSVCASPSGAFVELP
jgi:hypothetical protein